MAGMKPRVFGKHRGYRKAMRTLMKYKKRLRRKKI